MAIKRAGLVDFRVHDSRHDNATKIIRNGGTLQELQLLLGHSRIETTARYAHLAHGAVASKAVGILNRVRPKKKAAWRTSNRQPSLAAGGHLLVEPRLS